MAIDLEGMAHLAILAAAYALGCAIGIFAPRPFGAGFVGGAAAWLVLLLPLVLTLTVEALTGFWLGTPGTLGLGSLTAIAPLAFAGLASGVAALAFGHVVEPYPYPYARDAPTLLPWLGVALAASLVALALWYWWPAPRPRLW